MRNVPRALPRWQLILYASGALASALSSRAPNYVQFLYIDILGLSAVGVGVIWSIYGLWNGLNDPIAGYLSDRTRTRWGRRIPWIAALFLPLSIAFYLLWVPPAGWADRSLVIYLAVVLLSFDLMRTIVGLNRAALFPEMVLDRKQRASVLAWREGFAIVGLLAGFALPPALAGEDWSGRGGMALYFAIVIALFLGLSLLGSRERPIFRRDTVLPLRQALRSTLRNRDFLFFVAMNLMLQFAFMTLTTTMPFYTKYVLRIQAPATVPGAGFSLPVGVQTSLLLAAPFLVALPSMSLWGAVARRRGAWGATRLAHLAGAAIVLLLLLSGSFWSGLAVTATFGIALAGLLMLPDLLIANLVDADELATGSRREGLYFGIRGLLVRPAVILQGLLTGAVLSLTGYVAPTATIFYPAQPPAALAGIRLLVAGLPALALLVAFFVLRGYTLRGERLATMRAQLAALHEQKLIALQQG